MARVLAAGIYLADRPNTAAHLMRELAASEEHAVTQRWIALAPGGRGRVDLPETTMVVEQLAGKFELLDRLTGDAAGFDWLLLCDDDVEVGLGFVDRLIGWAQRCDLALSQPARTVDSFVDHPIVHLSPGLGARRTRFVEIGPLACIRRDAMALLLPFGDGCGMGWGLDFVWPVRLERAGLRLGIVDAAPIAHRLRPRAEGYDLDGAHRAMAALLAREPHLSPDEAHVVLEAHP